MWLDQSGHGGLADLRVHLAVSTARQQEGQRRGFRASPGRNATQGCSHFWPQSRGQRNCKILRMQVCTSTGEPLHLAQHIHCLIPTLVLPTASTFFRKNIEGEETVKNNSCQGTQNFKVPRGKKQAPLVSTENLLTPPDSPSFLLFLLLNKDNKTLLVPAEVE